MDTICNLIKQLFLSSQSQSAERKDDNEAANKIQKHLHVDNNYGKNLVNPQLKNLELEKQKLAYKKSKKERVILNKMTASIPFFQRFNNEIKNFGNEFKENVKNAFDELIKMGFTVNKLLKKNKKIEFTNYLKFTLYL